MSRKLVLWVGLALGVAACADGDGSGESLTVISATEGGTLTVEDGAAVLEFPPDSVTEDVEVVVAFADAASFAPLEGARRAVSIEPAGLALRAPARITIRPGDPPIQDDQIVSMAQFQSGRWTAIEAGFDDARAVQGQIRQLAAIAVVVEDIPEGPTGRIVGSVIDSQERPVGGLQVDLTDLAGSVVTGTRTGDDGGFAFDGVPVGSYKLRPERSEAGCASQQTVSVREAQTAEVLLFLSGEFCP